jgi:hypothetical protein
MKQTSFAKCAVREFAVREFIAVTAAVGLVLGCGGLSLGQPVEPPPPRADRHPQLRRLSPTEEIWIDVAQRQVVVGARVALDTGPIEVFACPRGTKDYEAVVSTLASARLVHTALLAIGLEPGSPVSFDPDYAAATGPPVSVTMRWQDAEGVVREARGQDWVRDARTGKPLTVDWVFAGSRRWQDDRDGTDVYEADQGDLVCVSNFPSATLDLPIESSDTNDDLLFEVFAGRVPPKGTEVDMILAPAAGPGR